MFEEYLVGFADAFEEGGVPGGAVEAGSGGHAGVVGPHEIGEALTVGAVVDGGLGIGLGNSRTGETFGPIPEVVQTVRAAGGLGGGITSTEAGHRSGAPYCSADAGTLRVAGVGVAVGNRTLDVVAGQTGDPIPEEVIAGDGPANSSGGGAAGGALEVAPDVSGLAETESVGGGGGDVGEGVGEGLAIDAVGAVPEEVAADPCPAFVLGGDEAGAAVASECVAVPDVALDAVADHVSG